MHVRELKSTDRKPWLEMRSELWPHCDADRHVSEMHAYFSAGGLLATFVAEDEEGMLRGFVEGSLRPSAEGCTTRPVGYLEGIYVQPDFRRRGMARLLVAALEQWAGAHGCTEFASDCHHDNDASIRFHVSLGFDVAKQLVHFRREISGRVPDAT